MNKNVLKIVFLINSLSTSLCYANESALVLGYQSFTHDELWHEKQVGIGVKNLVQQRLIDKNTFIFNNKKDADENALLDDEKLSGKNLEKVAAENKLNHIFWVAIQQFSSATSRFEVPFLSKAHYDDNLVLKICHYVVETKTTDCKEGEATASRSLSGVLYEPNSKINFNETAAARLTQSAINEAFSELFPND